MNNNASCQALRKFWCIPDIKGNLLAYFIIAFVFVNVCKPIAVFWIYASGYDYENAPETDTEILAYKVGVVVFLILLFFYGKWRIRKFKKTAEKLTSYGIWESVIADFGRYFNNRFMNKLVLGENYIIQKGEYIALPYSCVKSVLLTRQVIGSDTFHKFYIYSNDERFKNNIVIITTKLSRQQAEEYYNSLYSFISQKNPNVVYRGVKLIKKDD